MRFSQQVAAPWTPAGSGGGRFGHVEVLEGVELPHAYGGGDGEQEVAGLGVGRPELDPAECEARERGHRSAGFSWSVPVYLSPATLHICFSPEVQFRHSRMSNLCRDYSGAGNRGRVCVASAIYSPKGA